MSDMQNEKKSEELTSEKMAKPKQPGKPKEPKEPREPAQPEVPQQAKNLEEQLKSVVENGAVVTNNGKHVIHCITIIGQIEGHYVLSSDNKTTKYEHVIPQLVAVEESQEVEGLLMILNTVGGDIEAGLALAELIAGMSKPTVSLVLGGGHSIGVPLAVAATKSFIAPSATMTLHPVRTNGLVLGVPQAFRHFEKMQQRITQFVSDNSHISTERFTELVMNSGELVTDMGSILDGEKAVAEGLIDELGSLSAAIQALYDLIDENHTKNEHQDSCCKPQTQKKHSKRQAAPKPNSKDEIAGNTKTDENTIYDE